ncbi:hypothetical protein B0H21DRAFT_686080 [Amylocystis lapponica]|nr:hypothetical protein B0H21DRAFT_686080 [Amylocystis lapponica]
MLVLHPNSTCDVCLEGYTGANVPHSISCGHIFCLRCLQSLTRHCCPLCRTPFHIHEVRRLHIDKGGRSPSPSLPVDSTDLAELSSHARRLHNRITHIVREGASMSDVRDVLEEVRGWLLTQPPDEHADLRSVYLLLFRYTDLQYRAVEDKRALADIQRTCDDLKEQLQSERQAADTKCQELSRQLSDEMDTAKAVEKSLRERYSDMDKEWNGKYEVCVAECRRLLDEVKELRRKGQSPVSTASRPGEARYYYLMDPNSSNAEPMAIVKEDPADSTNILKVQIGGKDDMFHLSPVPMTLPIPALPSATFRALTDDVDDRDDDMKSNNPYLLRSIQPIPIKSSLQRMPSTSSLLSRHDSDISSRSLPRGSSDVQMASCSSSPNTSASQYPHRDRSGDLLSSAVGLTQESALGLRLNGSRRSSQGAPTDSHEQAEQHERWRAQLRDLLDDPKPTPPTLSRRNTVSETSASRQNNPTELAGAPRHPSPVSSSASVSNFAPVIPHHRRHWRTALAS